MKSATQLQTDMLDFLRERRLETVVFFDIDCFSTVNETQDLKAGDKVLGILEI